MSYVGVERRNFSKLSKTSSRVLPLTAARLFAFPTLLWVLSRFNVRILPSLFLPRQDIKTKQNIHHVKHHSWTDSQRLCNLNAPTPNHWRQSFLITIICPKNALFLGGKWFLTPSGAARGKFTSPCASKDEEILVRVTSQKDNQDLKK